MSGKGSIGPLWTEWNAALGSPVAVYSGYQCDKDGEYDYMLGVTESSGAHSAGVTSRTVEAGDYLRLKHDAPATPEAVVELWKQIWELERTGRLARAYRTDYEIYTPHGFELYVGVKR
jgi:predicted transcriptional regulator YdeE